MENTELEKSGRPKFYEGEVEIISQNRINVSIIFPSNKLPYGTASLTLTTHRLLFRFTSEVIGSPSQHAPLSAITSIDAPKSTIFHRYTHVNIALCDGTTLQLKFSEGGRENFVEQLTSLLSKRPWVSLINHTIPPLSLTHTHTHAHSHSHTQSRTECIA
jgi:hypothetical protein